MQARAAEEAVEAAIEAVDRERAAARVQAAMNGHVARQVADGMAWRKELDDAARGHGHLVP